MSKKQAFDVVVVGAGIAGCHVAQLIAHAGMSVGLIDKRPLEKSGPQWVNAVPLWMFDEAGLLRPKGHELFDLNGRFIIRAPDLKARLTIEDLGIPDVHMGFLGKRLKDKFMSSLGAKFFQAKIKGCEYDQDKDLKAIWGEDAQGRPFTLRAQVFIDSSGLGATLRKSHPLSDKLWPKVSGDDSCTAAQCALKINDPNGAASFLEKNTFLPGDVLSEVGFMGGYSLFRVQIAKDLQHISLLCGVRDVLGYKNASQVIQNFLNKNLWIGQAFINGRGRIPINAPYETLAASRIALLGDSGSQVYPAHGSGIGIGLIAAKILADRIIEAHRAGNDIGHKKVLSAYTSNFHGRYYERLYFSQQFRRFSQNLDENATATLIESKLLNAELAKQMLMQEAPTLPFNALSSLIGGAFRSPQTLWSMLPVFAEAWKGKAKAKRLARIS